MFEARLEMARLPLRAEFAPKDVRAIQAEEMALHTMRILRRGASDGRGLPRQSIIEGVEGSWALGCEDGSEGRA